MRKLFAVLFVAAVCGAASADTETNVFENPVPLVAESPLDKLVFAQLARLKLQPVLCSDAVFVRRVYLDVIGTLPTAKEAREFIQDPDTKNKRRRLIDRLLERDEFADYWAMKWGDILRIKAEFPVNLWPNAAQAYHRWVRASIAENKPYDKFARELLTSSGSNFRVGPVNFYRAIQNRTPEGIAARRGPDVHGRAGGDLADEAVGGHGGLLLADRLQAHQRVEGGERLLGSAGLSTSPAAARRARGWQTVGSDQRVAGSAPVRTSRAAAGGGLSRRHRDQAVRRTAIRGRSSPIG